MQFKTEKFKVLHLCRNNPMHQYMLGDTQIQNSLAENDLVVLVDKKAMCPCCKYGKWYPQPHYTTLLTAG